MVFRTGGAGGAVRTGEFDIVGFRPDVDSVVMPLVASPDFVEQDPALSPDGRWLAYTSDETGQNEVHVRPFPDVESTRVQVSTDGGYGPLWAHGGSELFFVDAGSASLISAEVETAQGFRVLQRETLFPLGETFIEPGSDFHDVTPDDQRFLMFRVASPASPGADDDGTRYILVQNFFEERTERVGN